MIEDVIPVVVRCPVCGAVLDLIDDCRIREAVAWGYLAQKAHEDSGACPLPARQVADEVL